MKVRALQGDTVDALCHRHLGSTRGLVEATLELNPGLASHGPFLPQNLLVNLPDPQTNKPTAQLINLWN